MAKVNGFVLAASIDFDIGRTRTFWHRKVNGFVLTASFDFDVGAASDVLAKVNGFVLTAWINFDMRGDESFDIER